MADILERVIRLNFTSSEAELEEVLNQVLKEYSIKMPETGIEKVRLIYQIQEMKNQATINRRVVFATWAIAMVTIIGSIINIFSH